MTPDGKKGNFAINRNRLRDLMRLFPALQIDRIERDLEGTRAVPDQPVQLARHVDFSRSYYV